jgi:hypothetical protein
MKMIFSTRAQTAFVSLQDTDSLERGQRAEDETERGRRSEMGGWVTTPFPCSEIPKL